MMKRRKFIIQSSLGIRSNGWKIKLTLEKIV